jgi:DNA modification methylase
MKQLRREISPGFVWRDALCGHVVACADATDPRAIRRLVWGTTDGPVDLALTDPPYALARDAKRLRLEGRRDMYFDEEWDRFGDDGTFANFLGAIVNSNLVASPGGNVWIWTSDWWVSIVKGWFKAAGLRVWPTYHWCKPNPPPSIRKANPTSAVEYLAMASHSNAFFDLAVLPRQRNWFVARPDGAFDPAVSPHWVERAVVSQAERLKRADGRDVNQTQKPLDLVEALVRAGCPEDGLVLDACGGTGTTLVAADRTGRRCVYVDLDPDQVRAAASRLQRDRRER